MVIVPVKLPLPKRPLKAMVVVGVGVGVDGAGVDGVDGVVGADGLLDDPLQPATTRRTATQAVRENERTWGTGNLRTARAGRHVTPAAASELGP
jgi:hypothetical protein